MRSTLIFAIVLAVTLAPSANAQPSVQRPWHFATWHSQHHAVIGPFDTARQCNLIRSDWLAGASSNSSATRCWQA